MEACHQALKMCTALMTYCLHIGHSFICFPHLVQVTMWPHSSSTQSIGESMHILHTSGSSIFFCMLSVVSTDKGSCSIIIFAAEIINTCVQIVFTWNHTYLFD